MNILLKWKELALTECVKKGYHKDCLQLLDYIASLTQDMPFRRHEIQKAILDIIDNNGGALDLKYRPIARILGEIYPEKIKYHLIKLHEQGEIEINFKTKKIKKLK